MADCGSNRTTAVPTTTSHHESAQSSSGRIVLRSTSAVRMVSKQLVKWTKKHMFTSSSPVRIVLWCFIVILQPWIAIRNSSHCEYNSPVVLLGMVQKRDVFVVLYYLFEWIFRRWCLNLSVNMVMPLRVKHNLPTGPDRNSRIYTWRRLLPKWLLPSQHVSNGETEEVQKRMNTDIQFHSNDGVLVSSSAAPSPLPLKFPVTEQSDHLASMWLPSLPDKEEEKQASRSLFYKPRRKSSSLSAATAKQMRSRRYEKIAALLNRNDSVQETNSSTPSFLSTAAVGPTAVWVFTMDQPTDSFIEENTNNNDSSTLQVNDNLDNENYGDEQIADAASMAIAAQTPHLDDDIDADNQLSVVDSARNVSAAEDTTLQRVYKAVVNPARVNFEQPKTIPKGAVLPSRNANKGARQKSRGRRAADNAADHIRPIDLSASTIAPAQATSSPSSSSAKSTNGKNSQQQHQHHSRSASGVGNDQNLVTVSKNSAKTTRLSGTAHNMSDRNEHAAHQSLQFQSQSQPWGASDVATPTQYDDEDNTTAMMMYQQQPPLPHHDGDMALVPNEYHPQQQHPNPPQDMYDPYLPVAELDQHNNDEENNGAMFPNQYHQQSQQQQISYAKPKRSNLAQQQPPPPIASSSFAEKQRHRVHFDLPDDSMDGMDDAAGFTPLQNNNYRHWGFNQQNSPSCTSTWQQSSTGYDSNTIMNNTNAATANRFVTSSATRASPSSEIPYKSPFMSMYKKYMGDVPSSSSAVVSPSSTAASPKNIQKQQQPYRRDDHELQYTATLSPVAAENSPRGRTRPVMQQQSQRTSPGLGSNGIPLSPQNKVHPLHTSPTASISRRPDSPSQQSFQKPAVITNPQAYNDDNTFVDHHHSVYGEDSDAQQQPYNMTEETTHLPEHIPAGPQQQIPEDYTSSTTYASPGYNQSRHQTPTVPLNTSNSNNIPFHGSEVAAASSLSVPPQIRAYAQTQNQTYRQQEEEASTYTTNAEATPGYSYNHFHNGTSNADYATNSNRHNSSRRTDEERRTKQSLLLEMDKMIKLGHVFTRKFTYDDPVEDMEYELEMKRVNDRHASSVNGLIQTGKTACTMLAFANEKMGPFLNLDGDSDDGNFFQKIDPFFEKHRGDIEALYQTYFKRGPSNPIFNILVGIVGLFVTTHFANTYGHLLRPMKSAEAAAMKGHNTQREATPTQQPPFYYNAGPAVPPPTQPYMPAYGYSHPGAVPTPYFPYYQYPQQHQPGMNPATAAPNAAAGSYYHHNPYQQQWDNPNPYGYPTMPSQPYMPPNLPGSIPQQQQHQPPPVYSHPYPHQSAGSTGAVPINQGSYNQVLPTPAVAPPTNVNNITNNNPGVFQPPVAFMNPGYVATPQPIGMPPHNNGPMNSNNHVQSANMDSDDPDEPIGEFPAL